MRFTWRTEWVLWLLLASMFALALVTWQQAPDRIPTHWGPDGEVNGYSGKFVGLLLLPLIALGIYLMFLVLPRIDPSRANYAEFAGAYLTFRFAVLVFLELINGIIHLWLRGHRVPINTLVPVFLGGLFLVMGSVMGKFHPNWFVGIRTPWTLSSRRSWDRTQRLAGRVFMLAGICLLAAGALHSTRVLIASIVVTGVGILGTVVYSYFVWRGDPNRRP